jgi:hypothetical protein
VTACVSIVTTNYDILVEQGLRHRPMRRPFSPGCFYGGLPQPQILKGTAQPFSRWAPERFIEMTGAVPVFKLHGSLNWTLDDKSIVYYQDMRPVFRHGGAAAIVPPVPEKLVPAWLEEIWREAKSSLSHADIWVVCGYSMPAYDYQVIELLRASGFARPLTVFLLSPEADALQRRWIELLPEARIACLPGLPQGIEPLARGLAALSGQGVRIP